MAQFRIEIGVELVEELHLVRRTFDFCPPLDGDVENPMHVIEAALNFLRDNAIIGDDIIKPILEKQAEING